MKVKDIIDFIPSNIILGFLLRRVNYNAFVNITQIGKRPLKVTMYSKDYSKVVNFEH